MSEDDGLDRGADGGRVLSRALAFKRRLADGGVVVGAWLSLTDPVAAEIFGRLGFDFVIIDTEHGAWDLQPLQTSIMALNGTVTVPIVRVPWNDHVRIKQVLDLGAEGILAPMVRTVEECEALVAACRYPPVGRRGFGPRRASGYRRDLKAYEARANAAIFVMPQIEDIATLGVLDRFLAVTGIDAVAIGPNDMSGTAGVFRDPAHPTIVEAIERIGRTAAARGLPAFTGVNSPLAERRQLVDKGFRIQTIASDTDLMIAGAEAAIAATRRALAGRPT